ncbi:hypothetical protein SLEP1_g4870 [Rubroshorea leprosula]|uniref:Uncharacterized protein n=1 Tax=Rubroshorea leprosula TaxID=152421 RepID=A0AAV5HZL1_9ROSI|nr:hypothetical protein SLEP1_g4870 [Rubroshorea leprosula]
MVGRLGLQHQKSPCLPTTTTTTGLKRTVVDSWA